MSHGDLTDCEGEPDGGILAWATWSRLYGFATRRRNVLGQTGENGVWVPARRLRMVLFALAWLPAGIYASYTYLGVQYVPPVFLDELERFGREAAEQGVVKFNEHMPDGSEKFGWRLVPGAVAEVITLHARCADLTVVSLANRNESARRGSAELPASFAPSASRSVLAVPHIGAHKTPGQYITAAWNAGRDATRSIDDATPILERPAVSPNVNGDERGAIPCADIAREPARHGVHADAAITMGNGISVSDVFMSRISDTERDFFAMGVTVCSRDDGADLGTKAGAARKNTDSPSMPSSSSPCERTHFDMRVPRGWRARTGAIRRHTL